jgi:hypothetical protein
MAVFWDVARVLWYALTDVSEEFTVSIIVLMREAIRSRGV